MTTFNDFGLHADINRALAAKDYTVPTPIQMQAIPPLMKGRDLCGIAQTGTGKTAGFSLPSIHHLLTYPHRPTPRGCRMLVLAPTRELAAQIAQSCRDYGRFTKLSVSTVFGGVPINKQIRDLSGGVDILVATPGRLLDLIDQRALRLDDVEIFVLDEAGSDDGHGLYPFAAPRRQAAAVAPPEPVLLGDDAQGNCRPGRAVPQRSRHRVGHPRRQPPSKRSASSRPSSNRRKSRRCCTRSLRRRISIRALIFTPTKHGADRVVRHLAGAGIKAMAIHGNKSQSQRTHALQAFRSGDIKLLVATDIAARGIDVSGVSHVINFEIPNVPEQYVHRIGRTARCRCRRHGDQLHCPR